MFLTLQEIAVRYLVNKYIGIPGTLDLSHPRDIKIPGTFDLSHPRDIKIPGTFDLSHPREVLMGIFLFEG